MKKRYQAIAMSLIFLIGMIFPVMSFAQERGSLDAEGQDLFTKRHTQSEKDYIWPVQRLVPENKEWKITFSEPIDDLTVKEGNIDVYNSDNKKHKIKRITKGNEITIVPEEKYPLGNYRLEIKNVRSIKGTAMKKTYVMRFRVQEDCPVGGMALWVGENIEYPTFKVFKKTDLKGTQLTLGFVVKDIQKDKLVGRIIEIKEEKDGYVVTMDRKCIHEEDVPTHESKQRRMYSFGNAKAPSFLLGVSGEELRRASVSDNDVGSYVTNMRPGDIVYQDPDPTHGQSQEPGTINSQPEMNYVGVVTDVQSSDNGEYLVKVQDKAEEDQPAPYDPGEESYNPPANPIASPDNLRTIDGHMHHTVFIRNGELYSMGYSAAMKSLVPKKLESLDGPFKQVAAEQDSCIALAQSGSAYRYKTENGGMWVNIQEDNPAFDQMEIKQVAAGDDFYLILNSAGEVWRHGNNSYFGADSPNLHASSDEAEQINPLSVQAVSEEAITVQEERHQKIAVSFPTGRPVNLPGRAVQIDAVGKVALARMENGDVYMWGNNSNAQIDPQQASGQPKKQPFKVEGLKSPIKMVQTDGERTVVLTTDGKVYFWGKKWEGLGSAMRITQIDKLYDITKIAVKKQHMLALRKDGVVFSIGSNGFGELGIGHANPQGNDVFKVDFNGALMKDIGVGDNTSYAVAEDGKMWVWGNNINGQLGLGTRGSRATIYYPVLLYSIEEQQDFSF